MLWRIEPSQVLVVAALVAGVIVGVVALTASGPVQQQLTRAAVSRRADMPDDVHTNGSLVTLTAFGTKPVASGNRNIKGSRTSRRRLRTEAIQHCNRYRDLTAMAPATNDQQFDRRFTISSTIFHELRVRSSGTSITDGDG